MDKVERLNFKYEVMEFEYKVVVIAADDVMSTAEEKILAYQGSFNWELINIVLVNGSLRYYFKREKKY